MTPLPPSPPPPLQGEVEQLRAERDALRAVSAT
jgi:hypothetical protein